MMTRTKLHEIKSAARTFGFEPTTQLVHSLVDHGLDALTELEGGASVMEQRAALMERESQVKLALEDLRHEQRSSAPGRCAPTALLTKSKKSFTEEDAFH